MVDVVRLAVGLRFPEGPAFDAGGQLWVVELNGGALARIGGDVIDRVHVGGAPNGLAFHGDEGWFCDADGGAVRRLDQNNNCETIAGGDDDALDRPNDLAFDAAGNLIFTCPGNSRREPNGSVWCYRRDGGLSQVASGMYFPNGLAFDPSGEILLVAETYRHRLWRGRWDACACKWLDPAPWCEVGGPIGPDGMAFGASGKLYVAVFDQGHVAVVDTSGRVTRSISTPGKRPTNVALDPSGRLGLIVTEAERGEVLSYPDEKDAPVLR